MSFFDSPEHLKLLQNLLKPEGCQDDDSDLEDEGESLIKQSFNPGGIGPPVTGNSNKSRKNFESPYAPLDASTDNVEKPPSTIEEWQQQQERQDMDVLDTRKCPDYKVTYRQAVGTEDIYLQMGNRTSASASCEDMLLDVMLPGETTPADKMDLTITALEVQLSTPMYRLKLPLSHEVNVDRCRAKYDKDMEKLTLALRLKRELDFVNF